MLRSSVLLWLASCVYAGPVLVQLTGKQLLKGKVMGPGYSLQAKSLLQCMDACNDHSTTCDGIVYQNKIGKCRMINKCAATKHVDNFTSAVFFSKRPIIKTDGFLHIPEADSCVGLLPEPADYASGDGACGNVSARLLVVRTQRANKAASNILRRADLSWAWISDNTTGNIVSGGSELFTPEVLERVNGTTKGCWAINYSGQWRQYPCKNYKLPTLCEVVPFPA